MDRRIHFSSGIWAAFLALNNGDFLMFHMDHAGVGGDVEMQAILQYTVV